MTKLVKDYKPQVLFLIESKRKRHEMDWLRSRWNFNNCVAVECMGRAGGLALLWMDEVKVDVQSFSKNHIDAIIGEGNEEVKKWCCTGFYGEPDTNKRQESWNLLRRLKEMSRLPWLCVGDFNELLTSKEKLGGVLRHNNKWIGSNRYWSIVVLMK